MGSRDLPKEGWTTRPGYAAMHQSQSHSPEAIHLLQASDWLAHRCRKPSQPDSSFQPVGAGSPRLWDSLILVSKKMKSFKELRLRIHTFSRVPLTM